MINEDGVTIDNRVYDAEALNPYRRTDSGVTAMNGRWEVHCDPYDVTAVWIRDHHQGGWITAPWVHRDLVGQPFGAAIYEHVRAQSARTGAPIRDDYIARRIAELLGAGPHDEYSRADARAVRDCRGHLERSRTDPRDAVSSHDGRDRLLGHQLSPVPQLRRDPRRSVRSVRILVNRRDLHQQIGASLRRSGRLPVTRFRHE